MFLQRYAPWTEIMIRIDPFVDVITVINMFLTTLHAASLTFLCARSQRGAYRYSPVSSGTQTGCPSLLDNTLLIGAGECPFGPSSSPMGHHR